MPPVSIQSQKRIAAGATVKSTIFFLYGTLKVPKPLDSVAGYVRDQGYDMTDFVITGLFHDLSKKRSSVMVQWKGDPERNLGLIVPFGCSLDDVKAEAVKALAALKMELENPRIISE